MLGRRARFACKVRAHESLQTQLFTTAQVLYSSWRNLRVNEIKFWPKKRKNWWNETHMRKTKHISKNKKSSTYSSFFFFSPFAHYLTMTIVYTNYIKCVQNKNSDAIQPKNEFLEKLLPNTFGKLWVKGCKSLMEKIWGVYSIF